MSMIQPVHLRFALPLLVLALAAGDVGAEGGTPKDAERTLSPHFVVLGDDPETDRLPLLGTTVRVDVSGGIAGVTVRQTYRNDGPRPIHAKYVFPASIRAAVDGLTMTVGDERVVATIHERERAKQEFAAAKRAGKNAALLEQQRPNVFTMNLANVMPGQTVDVELHYTELLVPEDGVYEFIYPTVVGPRYSEVRAAGASDADTWLRSPFTREGVPPAHALALSGTLHTGMPIAALDSPSHRIQARWSNPASVDLTLDEAESQGGNRDFVLRYRLEGGRIQTGLLLHEGADENFFSLMLQPPARVTAADVPPREYIFVIDVSGSMHGFPLETSKALMRDLVFGLRPVDTFNMIFFAGGSDLWSPRSRPATRANIESAVRVLDAQQGGGGTRLLDALETAMAMPRDAGVSRSLVVVTDGYIAAEKEVFSRIRAGLGDANVFAFGIGSSVNRFLVEGLAKAGMGEPFVVLGPEQAAVTAARFRDYIATPVLAGIRIAFEGFDAYDLEPAALPDLLEDRPLLVQGKWRGAPGGRIVVTGATGDTTLSEEVRVAASESGPGNAALRQLWARSRIAAIDDFAFAGEGDEEKNAVTALGLRYGLLTRHTSFIAIREVIVNPGGAGDPVAQPSPLPAGVSTLAIGQMGEGSEPEPVWLLTLIAAVALASMFGRRRAAARR
jgi:Ca-activated chloride channel family protein